MSLQNLCAVSLLFTISEEKWHDRSSVTNDFSQNLRCVVKSETRCPFIALCIIKKDHKVCLNFVRLMSDAVSENSRWEKNMRNGRFTIINYSAV